jgi:hypothetical protein
MEHSINYVYLLYKEFFRSISIWCSSRCRDAYSLIITPQNMTIRIILTFFCLVFSCVEASGQQLWQEMSLPTDSLVDPQFCVSPRGPVFVQDIQTLYRTRDHGQTWMKIGPPLSDKVVVDSNGTLYIATSGGIIVSTDDGDTWPQAKLNIPITYRMLEASRSGLEIGGLASSDSGSSWMEHDHGSTARALYCGTGLERLYWQDIENYWWENDTGGIIRPIFDTFTFAGEDVNPSEFLRTSNGHYFVRIWDWIYRSTDSGRSWKGIGPGDSLWHNASPSAFVEVRGVGYIGLRIQPITPYNTTESYATELSTDDGATWSHLGDAPGRTTATSMARDHSGMIYARMDNKVYRMANFAAVSAIASSGFRLFPPFPNPSQGTLSVRYEIPLAMDVSIRVLDLLGKNVLDERNFHESEGEHTAIFGLQTLPAGTYIVTIVADENHAAQTFIVAQ